MATGKGQCPLYSLILQEKFIEFPVTALKTLSYNRTAPSWYPYVVPLLPKSGRSCSTSKCPRDFPTKLSRRLPNRTKIKHSICSHTCMAPRFDFYYGILRQMDRSSWKREITRRQVEVPRIFPKDEDPEEFTTRI